ncbi:AzlC family ABC transporter permease [Enterococcus sp.]|uniref:AzlC family ABC transporter permease n=1 Tax=Enterococcus sp. TaxID=35783 RepID=UPI002909542D|nr:AzlC family ABC transporter permease [Enterococcus sp.]MDU5333769.1 AzlC family ABC transporter permease [Enterococcus sp.]
MKDKRLVNPPNSNVTFSKQVFLEGIRDGIPIGLGYFAVAFSLGITARNAGLTPFQGFLASISNNASAGQYAAFVLIAAKASYLEIAIVTLVTNARYLLMSCALSQRFSPATPLFHRLFLGYDITDELFGLTISRPGFVEPFHTYGAVLVAAPGWAVGTALGISAGNLLPASLVSALSVALYGMFLAVIIPPARKDRLIAALVSISFLASYLSDKLPLFDRLPNGMQTIFLTVGISLLAAWFFPVKKGANTNNE